MDDLESSGPVIEQTLRELALINRLLGGNHVTLLGIKKFADASRPLHILDIGCGGGDMLILMAEWARKNDIEMRFTGIDANSHIVDYAIQNTRNYSEIDYLCCDVLSEQYSQLKCDIVTATLFTHHFNDQQLIELFTSIRKQARLGMVINDIHRHWFAYHSIKYLTRLFSRSEMVRNDAAVSVRRAFSKNELSHVLYESGIHGFEMSWHWAFRWKVVAKWG
jgi:2-polyprenyl-3-methyl-5-hydroxy-6-metoxy-1,4-benzoquinol methylase